MRSSRLSRDTSKIISAISSRTRTTRISTQAPPASGELQSDSELSSAPSDVSDFEDTKTSSHVSPTSRKRKRGAATPATSTSSRAEVTVKTEQTNATSPKQSKQPRKARRQPAKSKTTQDGDTIVEPPPNWEEMYTLAKEVRAENPAPVDTMGCERVANKISDPRTRRFQTLIALMLSSQTKDTVTAPTIWKMQQNMPGGFTLESMLRIPPADLNALIAKVGFHNTKTKHIKATAERLASRFSSDIPRTIPDLMSLPGVGPKMAYLTMSAAWDRHEGIGVDVHVHRITNLWGWHSTKTPEETRKSLEAWLPRERWHEINGLLVGLGQTVCLPVGRRCGECRLAERGVCPGAVVGKGGNAGRRVRREVKVEAKVEGGEEEVKEEVREEVVEKEIKTEEVPVQGVPDIEDIGRAPSPSATPVKKRRVGRR